MSDGLLTAAVVLLAVVAVVLLVGTAVVAYVYVKYRPGLAALGGMLGALAYTASPVDVLPELLLGPAGLLDDGGVLLAAALLVRRSVRRRRALPR
jgi:uncharacterized membrane protein YkvA (DUF1232 family)